MNERGILATSSRRAYGVRYPLPALLGASIALGYMIVRGPLYGAAPVLAFLLALTVFELGLARTTAWSVALLPWVVAFSGYLPHLSLTIMSTAAAGLLLVQSRALSDASDGAKLMAAAFIALLIASTIESKDPEAVYEGAKYVLFALMALVVASPRGRNELVGMRKLMLVSGVAAMAVEAVADVLHLGKLGSGAYYGAGEALGLGNAEAPHELALVGVMVAVACLLTIRDQRWRLLAAAIAAGPALATGVRSALVAFVLSLLVISFRSRLRPSMIAPVLAVVALILASGVGSIIVKRFEVGQARGEYSTLSKAGSGRGSLWTTAFDHWSGDAPLAAAFGSGLRSVEGVEEETQHVRDAVVQSDPLTLLVEIGLVGVILWLLLWLVIVRSGVEWVILIPLATYAITNGALEYVGAEVYGIALAGACATASAFARRPRVAP